MIILAEASFRYTTLRVLQGLGMRFKLTYRIVHQPKFLKWRIRIGFLRLLYWRNYLDWGLGHLNLWEVKSLKIILLSTFLHMTLIGLLGLSFVTNKLGLYCLLICMYFCSYIYYEQLVNYMMNNDLALKGHLDGVELLIFPSNILPENFQCKVFYSYISWF